MERPVTFIGFGEAAMAFADGLSVRPRAYDRKAAADATRRAKLADYERLGVDGTLDNAAATAGSTLILSLVTADCSLIAARETAASLALGALFLDMNSVAPATKAETAAIVEQAGGRYVDAAIMAPVHPKARAVPILLSGAAASDAAGALARLGFTAVRVVGDRVGQASAIKMIRSVMVKGLEALTTEMILAADAAGVTDEVIASLNASWPGADWAARADYNLDRMMVHGLRRAAEMEEVARTLDSLGTGGAMTRGTIERQRAIGALGLTPPEGLSAKISAVTPAKAGVAGNSSKGMPAFAGMTTR
jgi:3-hydroxyisobutyrate dehydrogenase-like beta-hydroxyacid dehydrogenase